MDYYQATKRNFRKIKLLNNNKGLSKFIGYLLFCSNSKGVTEDIDFMPLFYTTRLVFRYLNQEKKVEKERKARSDKLRRESKKNG